MNAQPLGAWSTQRWLLCHDHIGHGVLTHIDTLLCDLECKRSTVRELSTRIESVLQLWAAVEKDVRALLAAYRPPRSSQEAILEHITAAMPASMAEWIRVVADTMTSLVVSADADVAALYVKLECAQQAARTIEYERGAQPNLAGARNAVQVLRGHVQSISEMLGRLPTGESS